MQRSSELIAEKSSEQAEGYTNLALACKHANAAHRLDLAQFVKFAQQQTKGNISGGKNNNNEHELDSLEAESSLKDRNNNECGSEDDDFSGSPSSGPKTSLAGATSSTNAPEKSANFVIRYHQFQAPTTSLYQTQTMEIDPKNMVGSFEVAVELLKLSRCD